MIRKWGWTGLKLRKLLNIRGTSPIWNSHGKEREDAQKHPCGEREKIKAMGNR